MPQLLLTVFVVLISNVSFGQTLKETKGKVLAIDHISKTKFKNGDTLSIRVRNLTSRDRGFTIEAVALNKEPHYYNAIYSAYLNKDTLFFKKLEAAKKQSREENIQYVLPDYATYPFDIKGSSEKTVNFIVHGKSIQTGVLIKLRLTTDIRDDNFETIYSNAFYMFSLPD